MSAASRTPQLSPDRLTRIGQVVHLVTALVSAVSLVIQLGLIVAGVNVLLDDDGAPAVALGERLVRFISYFTVQSNVLVVAACTMLAIDPERDGARFRVLRIASLVGITVTFVVYLVALRPILDLHGLSVVTDAGLHIVTPLLAIGGWLVLGPRPRLALRTILWSLLWPGAYVVYSLVRGAVTGWYPYPFVDVTQLGYPVALRNLALIVVLMLAVGAVYLLLDRRLRWGRRGGDATV